MKNYNRGNKYLYYKRAQDKNTKYDALHKIINKFRSRVAKRII